MIEGADKTQEYLDDTNFSSGLLAVQVKRYNKTLQAIFPESG